MRPDTAGFHPDTCRSGLSAVSLWTAQPLSRICEQPRQLHCFCRFYGSSRRSDRAICVAEDSAPLWLPVEALFTCLIICCPNKPPLYPHLNPASPSWQNSLNQQWIQRDRIRFTRLSCNREHCWVSMPPSSTPQHMRWTLSMPKSRSSSRGSMICSGRRLTLAAPSMLAFLWNPNRMPTIPQFMMATLILAKLFSPSVRWCFHCSRNVIAPKKQVAFVLTLLSGRAREWGIAVWRSRAPCFATFVDFCQEMTKLFDRSSQGDEAVAQLSRLSQRKCSVTDFAIQFQTLAAACGWNEGALRARFHEGLDEAIADELAAVDLPRELDNLINLALRVEGRLNRRRQCRQPTAPWCHLEASSSDAASHLPAEVEPMQLGRLRLTPQQRQERLALGLCLYCGKAGHFVLQCPLKVKAHQWSGESWWVPLPVQTLQLRAVSCPFDSPSREVRTLVMPFWIQGLRGISWILPLLWDGTSRPFPWPSLLRRGH